VNVRVTFTEDDWTAVPETCKSFAAAAAMARPARLHQPLRRRPRITDTLTDPDRPAPDRRPMWKSRADQRI
jgi:hypothetical protein